MTSQRDTANDDMRPSCLGKPVPPPPSGSVIHVEEASQVRYRDAEGAAAYLGGSISARTLAELRGSGGGPRWVRIGRTPVYRVDWLDEWADARSVLSTSAERARRRA